MRPWWQTFADDASPRDQQQHRNLHLEGSPFVTPRYRLGRTEGGVTGTTQESTDGTAGGAYKQQLARRIGAREAAVMTVAGIIPVGSIFLIAPDVFASFGSGFLTASLIAVIMCFGIAYCYAELGAVYPIAGGQYAIAARVLGPAAGFLTFMTVLVLALMGPTIVGLGVIPYMQQFIPGLPTHIAAAGVILGTGALACISIKGNAKINLILFVTQIATVGAIVWLGFSHPHQSISLIWRPVMEDGGKIVPVAFGTVMAGVALAITVFNGYDGPLELSEEIKEPTRNVPKAILFSLCGAALMGFLPTLAIFIGAPSLTELMSHKDTNPIDYVLKAAGGSTLLANLLTASVITALLIGNTVAMTNLGRIFYSSGRDNAWPGPISRLMASVHPRTRTPVFATMALAIVSAVLALLNNIASILNFGALLLVVIYTALAVSALVSRIKNRGLVRPYRMPLWPLPPLVALVGCGIIIRYQEPSTLLAVAIVLALGALYYVLYLRPRPNKWVLRDPVGADESAAAATAEEAS